MLENLSWRGIGASALALVLCASPAIAAPDATAVADSLVAATAATGRAEASYESATASGETITITGYQAKRPSGDTLLIPTLVIEGAVPRENGGFTADSLAFDAGTLTRGKDKAAWETGLMQDITVPSPEEIKADANVKPFGSMSMSGITVTESNLAEPLTIAEVNVRLSGAEDSVQTFAAEISDIHFNTAVLEGHPREKAFLDALGYEEFDSDVTVAGSFDPPSQTMTLDAISIDTADVGTLTIAAQVTGITPGEFATTHNTPETRTGTKLESFSIRFENDGIVERALDIQAAVFGSSREQVAQQVATTLLPLAVGFIGHDEFEAKITSAVGEFLADPQSITFSADPASPVSIEQVLNTTLDSPGKLPDLLDADISANNAPAN